MAMRPNQEGFGGYGGGGPSLGGGGPYGGGGGYRDNQPLMSNGGYGGGPSSPYATGGLSGAGAVSGNHMNDVYFGAAISIVVGSTLGGISLFFSFKTVEWMQITYLMIFGLALAILDTPILKSIKFVIDTRMYISKYVQFVTRVTGKGVTLMFLGSMLFLSIWENTDGGFMKFIAVVLGFFPSLVGLASVVIGVLKSTKLEKARRNLAPIIDQSPDYNGGFNMVDFNDLSQKNGGLRFETLDLHLIFNALYPSWQALQGAQQNQKLEGGYANSPEPRIPKAAVVDWCRSGMVFL